MNTNRTYRTLKATPKWLYLVILLLTVLSISGLAIHGEAKLFAQQTTRAVSKPKPMAKSITYQRAAYSTSTGATSGLFLLLFDVDLGDLHTQQCKTQSCCSGNACVKSLQSAIFYKAKTIPQSSDDPAILFRIISSVLSSLR